MKTCPSCGARSAEDAAWCSQCYVRFEEPPEPTAEPPASETGPGEDFKDPDAMREPMNKHYSRWAKSEISMGPFGRVTTSLLLLFPFAFFLYAGVLGFVGMAMWVFFVMPPALRSIWKRVQVIDEGD